MFRQQPQSFVSTPQIKPEQPADRSGGSDQAGEQHPLAARRAGQEGAVLPKGMSQRPRDPTKNKGQQVGARTHAAFDRRTQRRHRGHIEGEVDKPTMKKSMRQKGKQRDWSDNALRNGEQLARHEREYL